MALYVWSFEVPGIIVMLVFYYGCGPPPSNMRMFPIALVGSLPPSLLPWILITHLGVLQCSGDLIPSAKAVFALAARSLWEWKCMSQQVIMVLLSVYQMWGRKTFTGSSTGSRRGKGMAGIVSCKGHMADRNRLEPQRG